jgi:flagellar basal body-associated protein FliL
MAEEQKTEGAAETAAASPLKSKKKLLIIGGAVALVLLIGAPTGYFLLRKPAPKVEDVTITLEDDSGEKAGKIEGGGDALEFEEGEEVVGAIVPFDTFLVNLTGGKYIRVQVQVEFESLDVPSRFYTRMVPIRDGIISLLAQQTADDLLAAKGKDKLRISIRNVMNEVLRREDVKRVYFTQFVIQ